MSNHVERTLHVVAADEPPSRPVDYWSQQTTTARLLATIELHREGNALLRGGNPPFVYTLEVVNVDRPE